MKNRKELIEEYGLQSIKSNDWSYIAGLIDGEGSIGMRYRENKDGNRYHTLCLSIGNTDVNMIKYLYNKLSGSVDVRKYDSEKHNPLFRWQAHSRLTEAILSKVKPYLITKRQHAELALEFRDTVSSFKPVTDDVWEKREEIYYKLRKLNARGKDAQDVEINLDFYEPKESVGSCHPNAKLTEEQVKDIRFENKELGVSFQKLADRYNVSSGTIGDILGNNTWKGV